MQQTEVRVQDSENPNVSVVITSKNGVMRFVRETKNSSGQIIDPDDAEQTIETITVTRKEFQQIS